jgi:hypothetical protein
MRAMFDYFSRGPNTQTVLQTLAAFEPRVLTCIHGSCFAGDARAALPGLASALRQPYWPRWAPVLASFPAMGTWRGGCFLGVAGLLVACSSASTAHDPNAASKVRRILVPRDNSVAVLEPAQCAKLCPAPRQGEERKCEDAGGSDELLADVAPGAHALVLCSYRRAR